MMGCSVKEARKAIRAALKEESATLQFAMLRAFCMDQAHELDGDSRCMVCGKWMKFDELKTFDVDGIICKRCEP